MCKYVYRYIGCITDQFNWFGPLSLVVVSWSREFDPRSGRSTKFSLQIFSSYHNIFGHFFFKKPERNYIFSAIRTTVPHPPPSPSLKVVILCVQCLSQFPVTIFKIAGYFFVICRCACVFGAMVRSFYYFFLFVNLAFAHCYKFS